MSFKSEFHFVPVFDFIGAQVDDCLFFSADRKTGPPFSREICMLNGRAKR
jgi:hypothetical protein